MAIPAAMKSTPALFVLGTAGVVGITAASLSSSGGGHGPRRTAELRDHFRGDDSPEEGEHPDAYIPSLDPAVGEGWNVPTAADMDPEGAPDWRTLDKSKNLFNLYPSRCTRSFFAESREKLGGPLDSGESEEGQVDRNPSLRVVPQRISGGAVEACSMMNLKRGGRDFLFRSELAAKNSRVGISLFTGLKNADNSASTGLKVRAVNYLLLFGRDKNGGGWTIRGGYTWGGSASPLHVKTASVKGPKGTIDKTFDGSGSEDTPETSDFYGGFWRPEEGGNESIFGRTSSRVDTYTDGKRDLIFSPLNLSGYGAVDGAYDAKEGKWKRFKDSQRTPTFTSAIEAWLAPFGNKGGKWRTIIEHCGSHATIPENQRLNHICYMSS